jgi:hypothetical protein
LLAICVAASADAHQANISTARVEALPQRFVAVELALKGSDVDQRCGTHAWSGAPWRNRSRQGETLRVMEESVLLSAATAYMDVSRDTANLEVQQNSVRVLQRTLKGTRNRFEAGQVTGTDVAQSEAQLAAAEASLHAPESTLMTTRAKYRRITSSKTVSQTGGMIFRWSWHKRSVTNGPSCEARRASIRARSGRPPAAPRLLLLGWASLQSNEQNPRRDSFAGPNQYQPKSGHWPGSDYPSCRSSQRRSTL